MPKCAILQSEEKKSKANLEEANDKETSVSKPGKAVSSSTVLSNKVSNMNA